MLKLLLVVLRDDLSREKKIKNKNRAAEPSDLFFFSPDKLEKGGAWVVRRPVVTSDRCSLAYSGWPLPLETPGGATLSTSKMSKTRGCLLSDPATSLPAPRITSYLFFFTLVNLNDSRLRLPLEYFFSEKSNHSFGFLEPDGPPRTLPDPDPRHQKVQATFEGTHPEKEYCTVQS